ncbi:MAG: phospholipase D-like domain-containing protein, partial [Finegoldia magna]|nr:phospholipase D-like domain-containing protein [Finegoldia magna]
WSFTIMFLSIWELYDDNELDYNYFFEKTVPNVSENEGYCQPYTDSPLDNIPVGKGAYMQLLSRSRKYFYITTPYLIPSDDMIDSLRDAAQSGVDVRIITPGIPDKKLVYMVTRTYYKTLLEAGVRIFEYTPGFLHAKSCVSDDKHCVVGSINLDFRSLYLHFENGAMYYDSHIVDDLKEDFLEMQSQSQEIFSRQLENQSVFRKILSVILKVFSPMI